MMTFHSLRTREKLHPARISAAVLIAITLSAFAVAAAEAANAAEAAKKFFDAYRDRKVDAMTTLFTENATFVYVPFGDSGSGNVLKDGVPVWRTLIDAFPDLRNEVSTIWEDKSGDVAFVDVHIGGKQTKDAFGITNKGKEYWLRHLFILETNEEGRIIKITSFWDNATWYTQLGKTSLE
ncbi:MAG: nuclear transport factor 2 family protein [Mesorhizobium sp.]|nr:MAG: nuclear transport factor 2 family protein [Mesorhizobium sp.]